MWLFLVLPSVVFATFGDYSFFTDHRNKHLDHNVSPCDNFFRHVCKPDLPKEERFQAKLVQRFFDVLNPYMPKIGVRFRREIQKRSISAAQIDPEFLRKAGDLGDWEIPGFPRVPYGKTSPLPSTTEKSTETTTRVSTTEEDRINSTNIPKIETTFSSSSEATTTTVTPGPTIPENAPEIDVLLYKLCPLFTDQFYICTPEYFHEIVQLMRPLLSIPVFTKRIVESVLSGALTYEAFHKYLKDHPDFLEFQPKVDEFFDCTKKSVIQVLKNTPWIRNKEPSVIDSLEEVSLMKINGTYTPITHLLEAGFKEFNKCLSSSVELDLCVLRSMVMLFESFRKLTGIWETYFFMKTGIFHFNAFHAPAVYDGSRKIYAFPALVGPFYEGIPETLGAAGTIFGHELGHITQLIGNVTWPQERMCFEGHRDKVCREVAGEDCNLPSNTFGEDIADYIGMQAILNIFKENYPEATKEDYQKFFYAYAISWCDSGRPASAHKGDVHSPHFVRTNGILRLFDEFSETFECKKGDYMRTEKEDRCVPLLGAEAPHYRK